MTIATYRRCPRDERRLARLVAAAGDPTGHASVDDAAMSYLALVVAVYVVSTLVLYGMGAYNVADGNARAIPLLTVASADLAMVVRVLVRSARFRRARRLGGTC